MSHILEELHHVGKRADGPFERLELSVRAQGGRAMKHARALNKVRSGSRSFYYYHHHHHHPLNTSAQYVAWHSAQ